MGFQSLLSPVRFTDFCTMKFCKRFSLKIPYKTTRSYHSSLVLVQNKHFSIENICKTPYCRHEDDNKWVCLLETGEEHKEMARVPRRRPAPECLSRQKPPQKPRLSCSSPACTFIRAVPAPPASGVLCFNLYV